MSKAKTEKAPLSEALEECLHEVGLASFKQGLAQGLDQGVRVGRMIALHGQLMTRFGRLPDATDRRVLTASPEEVSAWLNNILTAPQLDDLFRADSEDETEPPPKKSMSKSKVH